jgi:type IV secretion system protein VirB10
MSPYDVRPAGDPDLNGGAPRVSVPTNRWVMPLAFGSALVLGGVVFLVLSQGRVRMEAAGLTDPAPDSTPIIGLDNVPPPPDVSAFQGAPIDLAAQVPPPMPPPAPPSPAMPDPDIEARLKAPSLIVDLSEAGGAPALGPGASAMRAQDAAQALGGGAGARTAPNEGLNNDERFAIRFGGGEDSPARASNLANKGATVPQGSVIPAVLETAINSDLPGFARAVVSRDVYSFDGARVLIPRGSRVIGQYRSGVALGQSRAFVIWTRLIRPDGAAVSLGAPGADALGRGGLEGKVDRHFLRRFGGSILLSLISAGAAAAANGDDTQVIINSSRQASDAASVALQKEIEIPPTIRVQQGAPIRIFVGRDLDFSPAEAEDETE